MKAFEIMTRNPDVVTPEEPLTRAARLMEELDVGCLPVVDDLNSMRLIGMLTDRDIAVRHVAHDHRGDCPVAEHMTRGSLGVARPDDDVSAVMELMSREQVRRIPVVDDSDRLVGIVSQADVAVRVGPTEPYGVEKVIEHISEPARSRHQLVSGQSLEGR
jgi:CBS domain-containing protein